MDILSFVSTGTSMRRYEWSLRICSDDFIQTTNIERAAFHHHLRQKCTFVSRDIDVISSFLDVQLKGQNQSDQPLLHQNKWHIPLHPCAHRDTFAKVEVVREHTLDNAEVSRVIVVWQHYLAQVNIVRLILGAMECDWAKSYVSVLQAVVWMIPCCAICVGLEVIDESAARSDGTLLNGSNPVKRLYNISVCQASCIWRWPTRVFLCKNPMPNWR